MKIDQAPYIPWRITSGYGYRDTKNLPSGSTAFHSGYDFGRDLSKYKNHLTNSPCGSVFAVLGGTVKYAGYINGRGYILKIDHGKIEGKSVETWYQHLHANQLAKAGIKVQAGDTIGYMGRTGMSGMSVHLHFELHLNGSPVDPGPYFTAKAKNIKASATAQKLSATVQKLSDSVQTKYTFSTETMAYLSSYKYAEEMYRKMLARKPLSASTTAYIKAYKHGQAVLDRIYTATV